MAQATFSVRMDKDLKKQLDELCEEFGMTTSTAINIFARAVVRERKIPFEITSTSTVTGEGALEVMSLLRKEAIKNGVNDMSLEEINKEIDLSRKKNKK